jgi:hypothetical protein
MTFRYILSAILAIFVAVSLPAEIQAQTPQTSLGWLFRTESASNVSTYVMSVVVDGVTITTATLKPTCAQQGSDVACQIPVPVLAQGSHNVSITAARDGITSQTNINGLAIGANTPKNATDIKYQINITVNVP